MRDVEFSEKKLKDTLILQLQGSPNFRSLHTRIREMFPDHTYVATPVVIGLKEKIAQSLKEAGTRARKVSAHERRAK